MSQPSELLPNEDDYIEAIDPEAPPPPSRALMVGPGDGPLPEQTEAAALALLGDPDEEN